jgi:hypothetical protein
MLKHFCVLVIVFLGVNTFSFAQAKKDTTVTITKAYVDSILANDELMKAFDEFVDSLSNNKSYFDVGMGIGNRLFSLRNNAFNTQQVSTNKLTLTPGISYFNKTGLGLSWTSFLVFDSASTFFSQHALTPSYDYTKSDKVAFGISYTHYFIKENNSFSSTPFQNEVYGYVNAKKGWLQPGLSLGWAKGNYKETFETTRVVDTIINGVLYTLKRVRRDTIKTSLTDFSLVGSLKHDFKWYEILGNNDDITLTPMLMLVAGETKYKVDQTTSRNGLLRPRLFKTVRAATTNGTTGFRLQSMGLNLTATYTSGSFYLSPQYYFDYYLPNDLTDGEKRTTSVFTITVGVTF